MKGFVRILEAIIAAILVLTALAFFFPVGTPQSGWEFEIAHSRLKDIVATGVATGTMQQYVRANDYMALRSFIESRISQSADFSVTVEGIPPPVISIGCYACDGDGLEQRLDPLAFTYKERTIEFRIQAFQTPDDMFPIRDEITVIFFDELTILADLYDPLGSDRQAELDRFLERGGTIMLMDDVTQRDVEDSAFLRDVFGLRWSEDQGAQAPDAAFYQLDNANLSAFRVAKYFDTISEYTGTTPIGPLTPGLNKIAVDNQTIITDGNGRFSYAKTRTSAVRGSGRTLWTAVHGGSTDPETTVNVFVKAALLWGSGERFALDGPVQRTPGPATQTASMLVYDADPYVIRVTAWQIF